MKNLIDKITKAMALKKSFKIDKANLPNLTTPTGKIKVILNKTMYGKAVKQFGKKYTEDHYVKDQMVKLR